jgi:hypothetical protein
MEKLANKKETKVTSEETSPLTPLLFGVEGDSTFAYDI